MHPDCRIIVSCASTCFSHLHSNNKKLWIMCCIARNCKRSLILCVKIVLTRLCYVLLLSGKKNVLIVQPFLQKNGVCSSHEKTPTPNNLEFSKWNLLKKILLVLVFSSPLECFTFEVTPAQLIDPHSLTARPTQVSLCTCVKKNICCWYLVAQTLSRPRFFP
jgi:hypothetical protein